MSVALGCPCPSPELNLALVLGLNLALVLILNLTLVLGLNLTLVLIGAANCAQIYRDKRVVHRSMYVAKLKAIADADFFKFNKISSNVGTHTLPPNTTQIF